MPDEPSTTASNRARLEAIEGDEALLAAGESQMPVRLPLGDLPAEAEVGSWLIIDTQIQPPLVLGVDRDRPTGD